MRIIWTFCFQLFYLAIWFSTELLISFQLCALFCALFCIYLSIKIVPIRNGNGMAWRWHSSKIHLFVVNLRRAPGLLCAPFPTYIGTNIVSITYLLTVRCSAIRLSRKCQCVMMENRKHFTNERNNIACDPAQQPSIICHNNRSGTETDWKCNYNTCLHINCRVRVAGWLAVSSTSTCVQAASIMSHSATTLVHGQMGKTIRSETHGWK